MLPVVLGVGLALTFGAIGAFFGVKIGNWLDEFLTEEEKQDLQDVFSELRDMYDLWDIKEINQLPEYQKQELAEIFSQQLESKWGESRFNEFRSQIEAQCQKQEIEVDDNLFAELY